MRRSLAKLRFWLSRLWLRPFIALLHYRVVPSDPAAQLDAGVPLCYVLPERSHIDLLALRRICRERDLPVPEPMHERLPEAGQAAYLYLSALKEARLRRTPLSRLLDQASARTGYEVQILPVALFWGRDPGRETSLLRLLFSDSIAAGAIRRFLILLFNGRNLLARFGQPLSLRGFLAEMHDTPAARRKAARVLRLWFLRARSAVLGPGLLSRGLMIDSVLTSPAVRALVEHELLRSGQSRERIEARARRVAREIAADYSTTAIRVMELVLNWLWRRMFTGVEVRGLERLRETTLGCGVIYMPSHRSHTDYLLLSYALYQAGLAPPHVAAGANLNFWPVGGLLRRCGAFFMRRRFGGDTLYTTVFRAYVEALIQRGYPISFYPEGGRSRSGRLLPPRTGLLTMAIEAGLRQQSRPVALVPVFIAYDRVPELASYQRELRGADKRPESAGELLRAGRLLGNAQGGAYLSFGEPMLLWEYADIHLPGWREAFQRGDRPAGLNAFVERLATAHMRRINTVAAVPPTAVAACAMLATPRNAVGEEDLIEQIDHLLALLDAWPRAEKLLVAERDAARVIERAGRPARLRRVTHPWGDLLTVAGRDAVLLTYARNNIRHLFAFPALIAALFRTRSRLSADAVVRACRALYPFLQGEYYLPWEPADSEQVARVCLQRMVERGLLLTDAQTQHLRRPAVDDRAFGNLAALGRVLGDTFERYALTLMLLDAERRAGSSIDRKTFEADCRRLAERLALLSGRRAPEYLDTNAFRGHLDTLLAVGLVARGADDRLLVDARLARVAERSAELLADEVRQMLLQILARRSQAPAL